MGSGMIFKSETKKKDLTYPNMDIFDSQSSSRYGFTAESLIGVSVIGSRTDRFEILFFVDLVFNIIGFSIFSGSSIVLLVKSVSI